MRHLPQHEHSRSYRPHELDPELATTRVLLVHRDFAGTGVSHVGLGITAQYTMKYLREQGIWAEAFGAATANDLLERLRARHGQALDRQEVRPTHVVLSAPWVPTEALAQMAAEFPDIAFAVVSHSAVGFLSADPHAIRLLRQTADLQLATHNVFVAGNSEKFTDWAREAWGVHAVWLPNLYSLTETLPRRANWNGTSIRLGLFGANRPLKNMISSAAAAVELCQRLKLPTTLHVSSGRNEGGNWKAFDELTDSVPLLTVTRTGWLQWPQFRALVRTMDLVLQVSYTETFNVVTADAVAEGVPVVGSDAIDWIPRHWKAHVDEPRDITRVAEHLLRSPDTAAEGRQALERYTSRGLGVWRRFLGAGA